MNERSAFPIEYDLPERPTRVIPEFGERLPNGAIVIDAKPTPNDSRGVVILAGTGNRPTPFVTWSAYNGLRSTGTGHYFQTLREALEDYEKRTG